MKDFIKNLRENNIEIVLKNNDLEIVSYKENISQELLGQIRLNKHSIVKFLKESSLDYIYEDDNGNVYCETSATQREIWTACQDARTAVTYNMPTMIHFTRLLDIETLKKALKFVINKYEILRTNFKLNIDDNLLQVIHKNICVVVKEMNYNYGESLDFIKKDSYVTFDLENDVLLRCYLIHLPDDESIFYYNIHHIISDEWSAKIFKKEIFLAYEAFWDKKEDMLNKTQYKYRDYINWYKNQLNNNENHKMYWKNLLLSLPEKIHLPIYKIRPSIKSYDSKTAEAFLSVQETFMFNELVQKYNGSLFMGALTVLKVLLYKYSNLEDILIASPIAIREKDDFKEHIGYFGNILILRNKIFAKDSFNILFKRIKTNLIEAYEHSIYPISEILKDIDFKRDQITSSIFDISITFHEEQENIYLAINSDIIEESEGNGCKNDIEFHFTIINQQLCISVNYSKNIYNSETICSFIRNYQTLLLQFIALPNQPISDIEYLSLEEKGALLEEFNSTKVSYPLGKTIIHLFEEQVSKNPDSIAVVFEEVTLSYKDLNNQASTLAYQLKNDYEIKKGDLVGVMLGRGEKQIISILSILKLGAVYVPIDANLPESRKSLMSKELQLLITESFFFFDLDFYTGESLAIDLEFNGVKSEDFTSIEVSGSDIAYIIYTSGSTGEPKGVLTTYSGITNTILSQIDLFEVESYSRIGQFASFSFDASISEIFISLLSGKSLYILNDTLRKDPHAFEKYILENKIDLMTLPPAFFSLLNVENLKSLKGLITAGETALLSKTKEYLKYGTFYNAYGPTETSICASVYKIDKESSLEFNTVPIGKPISNTEIYILDDYGHLVPVGVSGELYISGVGLAKGYLNLENLTSLKFVNNPFADGTKMYRTGDLGRWLPDGNIEYLGRIDRQVKIRGHRIELGEIDSHVLSYSDDIKTVITEVKVHEDDKSLVVYYVSDVIIDKQKLSHYLENRLPQYMLPSYYVELESIPLTSNGKIDRKNLPKVSSTDLITIEYTAPRTDIEKVLIEICEKVLKQSPISIRDNYYNLGGDSIKSIQIVSKLRQRGYHLKVEHILQFPVLEKLSTYIVEQASLQDTDEEMNLGSTKDFLNYNIQKKWVYGESTTLSQNQHFFFRNIYSSVNLSIEIENFDENNFEDEFRSVISKFPFLMIRFEKVGMQIIQRYISEKEVGIRIQSVDVVSKSTEEIEKIGNEFMFKPYDLFEGEIIRLFILKAKNSDINKITLFIGIHHSLLDEYSSHLLKNELNRYFNSHQEITTKAHYFNFVENQNKFLKSDEGKKLRKIQLQKLLKVPLNDNKASDEEIVYYQNFVNQEIFITGDDFLHLQKLSQKVSLPLNAFCLSIFLKIISTHRNTDKNFYGILSTNRENSGYEEIPGILIDLIVSEYSSSDVPSIKEIGDQYAKMMEMRIDQRIPYEIIRQDIKETTNKDLEKNIIGLYNYVNYNDESIQATALKKYIKPIVAFDGVNLKIFEYSNGILLYLTHPLSTSDINFSEYVQEFINFLKLQ